MKDETVKKYYIENETARAYINRYAIHMNVTVEEAFKHKIVKEYIQWLMDQKELNGQ